MEWFKKNWLMLLCALIAAVSGTDVAAGMVQGKSLLNVTNLPSLAGGGGALGFLLFKLSKSGLLTKTATATGMSSELSRKIEAIFLVAEDPDMNDDMIKNLAEMASAAVIGHAARVRAARDAAK